MPPLRFEPIDGCREPELKNILGAARRNRKVNPGPVEEDVSNEMLLGNVTKGDKAAMHILFARHRARVSCFVQRLVADPAMADDLVNHLFLDVWRSANRLGCGARVSTWLSLIGRFRSVNSQLERESEVPAIAVAAGRTKAGVDRKTTDGILQACTAKLSPAHRQIIHLFYDRRKSIAEISEIAGVPHAELKSRLFYARKQLARRVVGAGFEAAAVRTDIRIEIGKASREMRQIRGRPRIVTRNARQVMTVLRENTL